MRTVTFRLLSAVTGIAPEDVLDLLIVPFAALGGGMAFFSGALAAYALIRGVRPEELSSKVDMGVAVGFLATAPVAVAAFGTGLSSLHG
jgi:hypothetical protein